MTDHSERFLHLLSENQQAILRLCKAYTIRPEDRQDLFQEIVFNLWKSLPGFKDASSLKTWVYRVALNICIRYSMNSRKWQTRHVTIAGLEFRDDRNIDSLQNLEAQEMHDRLYAAIHNLKQVDKTIALLYLEDLSHQEICEITGLTTNNVSVRLNRLKKQLTDYLEESS